MKQVRIVILADIDQDLYEEKKHKGFSDSDILRQVKESINVDYPNLRAACVFDYQVESMEPVEETKCPTCGVDALVKTVRGTRKCLACENEIKEG